MREQSAYYQRFLDEVQRAIPDRTSLVNKITDILLIEKDAVYRRLRGDVSFTFSEIAAISKGLHISLDDIIGVGSGRVRPMTMRITNYVYPSDEDYRMLKEYNSIIAMAKDVPADEFGQVSNTLASNVYLNFDLLTKFNIFKWRFQSDASGHIKPFHEIEIPERLYSLNKEYHSYLQYFGHSRFLLDSQIFQHTVSDIRYFEDMGLIRLEDVQRLKEELLLALDYLDELSVKGKYEETGNSVSVYVSDIQIDNGYTYVDIPPYKITIFKSFTIDTIASLDEVVFNEVKSWMDTLLRTSTVISVSNEKQRMMFFNKQREIINSLSTNRHLKR